MQRSGQSLKEGQVPDVVGVPNVKATIAPVARFSDTSRTSDLQDSATTRASYINFSSCASDRTSGKSDNEDATAELFQRFDTLLQRRLNEHSLRLEQSITRSAREMRKAAGIPAAAGGFREPRETHAPPKCAGMCEDNLFSSSGQPTPRLDPKNQKLTFDPDLPDKGNSDLGGRKTRTKPRFSRAVSDIKRNVSKTVSARVWEKQTQTIRNQTAVQRFVHGSRFELFWGFAIVSYAIFVGVQAHCLAVGSWQGESAWLAINWSYSFAFLGELVLRLGAGGRSFFVEADCGWNYFDLVIGMVPLFEIAVDVWFLSSTGNGVHSAESNNSAASMRVIRVLRIARLVRIVRVVRIIRFVHALRAMVNSILGTLRSLVWVMLLLFIIIYVFAVVFTQAVAEHVETVPHLQLSSTDAFFGKFWGGLPLAMLTLFQCVSNGLSWSQALEPLEEISGVWSGLFVFYICFAALAVMNVVTGVFCQSAMERAQQDQELLIQEQLKNRSKFRDSLRHIFEGIDEDGLGRITIGQLEQQINDPKVQAYFAALELDSVDALIFFRSLDCSDGIDCEDFVMGCTRLKGSAKAIHVAQLIHENKKMRQRMTNFMLAMQGSGSELSPVAQWWRPSTASHVDTTGWRGTVRQSFACQSCAALSMKGGESQNQEGGFGVRPAGTQVAFSSNEDDSFQVRPPKRPSGESMLDFSSGSRSGSVDQPQKVLQVQGDGDQTHSARARRSPSDQDLGPLRL